MFKRRKRVEEPARRQPALGNSAPVFSYRSSRMRTEATTGRHEEKSEGKRSYSHLVNLPTYIALGLIIGSVVYATTLSTQPRLQVFNSNQTTFLRDKSVYIEAAHRQLSSSVINLFKPTLDTEHVSSQLKQQFPELGVVNISIPLIDRHPIVQVTFATSRLILQTTHGDFVVSDTGRALVAAKDVPHVAELRLPAVIDQTGLQIKQGDLALTPAGVTFIATITAELQAKGVTVQSLTLPTTPEELDVKLASQPYYLKFNLLNDARQQAGSYLALKQKLDDEQKTPNEYIDLRVEEHAYYK